jgi:hypothetical protein
MKHSTYDKMHTKTEAQYLPRITTPHGEAQPANTLLQHYLVVHVLPCGRHDVLSQMFVHIHVRSAQFCELRGISSLCGGGDDKGSRDVSVSGVRWCAVVCGGVR